MKIITSQQDYDNARSRAPITLECPVCTQPFSREKHYVQSDIKNDRHVCCSKKCTRVRATNPRHEFVCQQCGAPVSRRDCDLTSRRNKKLTHHFCSQRCGGLYNAAHRKTGSRRAKMEIWIEEQLKTLYPNLEILYNHTGAILSELDIYIPSLKLAIELNGIFHYEPIFGQEKLGDIKRRDENKFAACKDKDISLCVIDTSQQRYHKPKLTQPYLDIIIRVIEERITASKTVIQQMESCSGGV